MTDVERRQHYLAWINNPSGWKSEMSQAFSPDDSIDITTPSATYGYRKRTGVYGTYYGSYITEKGDYFEVDANKTYADDSPQVVNIRYIYTYLTNSGWHPNAAIAVIGNIHAECKLNPGLWQSQSVGSVGNATGFGLVQWTPGSKKHIAWCMGYRWKKNYDTGVWYIPTSGDQDYGGKIRYTDPSSMDTQLAHLVAEMDPKNSQEGSDATKPGRWAGEWWHSYQYPLSKANFISATDSAGNLLSPEYLTKAFVVNYLRPDKYETAEKQAGRAKDTEKIIKYVGYVRPFTKRTSRDGVIENAIEPCYSMNRVGDGYDRCEGEGNCTWYAYGRAWEISAQSRGEQPSKDNEPTYLRNRGNAGNWYRSLDADSTFPKDRLGQEPKLGAIVCWLADDERKNKGWGHVAVVEDITYDTKTNEWSSFQYSHSGYTKPQFGTGTYKKEYPRHPTLGYKLQGFIYPDISIDETTMSSWYPIETITQLNDELTLTLVGTSELPKDTAFSISWEFPIAQDDGNTVATPHKNVNVSLGSTPNVKSIGVSIPPFAESFYVQMTTVDEVSGAQKRFDIFNTIDMTYPCVYISKDGVAVPYVPLMYTNNRWEPRTPYIGFNKKFYPLKTRVPLTTLYIRPNIYLLNVSQYQQQTTYTCGASSVVTILRYKNKLPSTATFPYDVYFHTQEGVATDSGMATTTITKLLNTYLGSSTYSSLSYDDNVDNLLSVLEGSLSKGFPVVALIEINDKTHFNYTTNGHYVVIDGVDMATKEIHIVDPNGKTNPYLTMSVSDFIDRYYVYGTAPYRLVAHIN